MTIPGLPEAGELLEGKYRIERVIGEGAWGEVLEGVNIRIQRRVAIKVLKAQYASNAQMVSRFEREALASTHIESPHVVQIFDAGVLQDGRPYMVMEFLTGTDLAQRIVEAGGALPVVESVGFCVQAARGLEAAHAASVFHRDMKPSNIVIAKTKTGREVAKIVDFGISKLLNAQDSQSNTVTGTLMGSPVYMSPEQARGAKTTDHRSDIYSLGVVLFECLTGRTPFIADSFNELLFKIALEDAPSLKSVLPEIDQGLSDIVSTATAKDADLRYQTAAELEGALLDWLQNTGGEVGEWASDTGPRGGQLNVTPTRRKSLPEIPLLHDSALGKSGPVRPFRPRPDVVGTGGTSAGPLSDSMRTRIEEQAGKHTGGVKDTGAALSKTADPAPGEPARRGSKKWAYVAAAAALLVVGAVGFSRLTSTSDPKAGAAALPEPSSTASAPASEVTPVVPVATHATPATAVVPADTVDAGASLAAADAGKPAVGAPAVEPHIGAAAARPPVVVAGAKSAVLPPTSARPAGSPAPTAPAATSVDGRTIRTNF